MSDHKEMIYNAHALMRDYYTYDELMDMPLGHLFDEIDFFAKKAKEIADRQAKDKIENELSGRSGGKRPRG